MIFRDTKPENFLLDKNGYLVLTDFGLAKDLGALHRSTTFCGSVAYFAPEILWNKPHGKALDWYLLGLIAYEMLTGRIPFYADNRNEMFRNI